MMRSVALLAALAVLAGSLAAAQPSGTRWPAVEEVRASSADLPGLLAVVPGPGPKDPVVVLVDGPLPAAPPTYIAGHAVTFRTVDPAPMMGSADDEVATLTPEQVAGLPPLSADPPTGPAVPPTIQTGIGPGSGLRQSAGAGSFVCTAAFLLRDARSGDYYLSTAGHCLVRDEADPTAYTGAANPDKVMTQVSICVSNCVMNVNVAATLGTYVRLAVDGDYHPVAYAKSGGIGADFGLIALPPEVHGQLRPWMPQWGGPNGVDSGSTGDLLAHYGHGTYCCEVIGGILSRTPLDQGRLAVSAGVTGGEFTAVGSSSGGDSGSGVSMAAPSSARVVQGTQALGVLTHGVIVPGVPVIWGTTMAKGFDLVRDSLGIELELVLEDDALAPFVPPASTLAITQPQDQATLDGDVRSVRILGNASVGAAQAPAVQVAIDDPAFGTDSRVPVTGLENWSATWDLAGVAAGEHVVRVRLVDGPTVLAQENRTVTVEPGSQSSSSTTTTKGSGSSTKGGSTSRGTTTAATGGPDLAGSSEASKKAAGAPGPSAALLPIALAAVAFALRRRS